MKLGNGRWESAKFNTRLQLTELGLGTSATDAGLWKVNYDYGELETDGTINGPKNTGNIAKQTLTVPGASFVQAYKYDPLYRLTEAKETPGGSSTANWSQNWNYDRYGNRIGFSQDIAGITTAPNPSVDANTNRFSPNQGFSYDKNGNITQDVDAVTGQSRTFVFNGDNKQSEVKDANGNAVGKYYYDGEGKRVKKFIPATGETTIFVYSSGKLIAEYSTQISQTPTVAYTTTDHLGSPRVITDAIGQVKSRRDFMPFGEDLNVGVGARTGDTGLKYASATDEVRQKFTGYQKDTETSLDFAEARMYESRYGRFTAVDPMLASGKSANPQTFNRYVYCLNNPMVLNDPGGLQVGVATGKVYINGAGTQVRIFPGAPRKGFVPLDHNISTTTMVGKVVHYMDVTPNGWTVGGRVDGATFAPSAPSRAASGPIENEAIRALSTAISHGVYDGITGTIRGIGNAPAVALNGLTDGAVSYATGGTYRGSNPFAVSLPFAYDNGNVRQASYGSAGSTGTIAGFGAAVGVFGGSSTLSAVPRNTSLFRAVSQSELSDIGGFGFRPNPSGQGYQGVKLFTRSAEEAAQYGRYNFGVDGQPFFVVETEAPGSVMTNSLKFEADWMRTVSVPSEQLPSLSTTRTFNFCYTCQPR